jgi:hypothetical protein
VPVAVAARDRDEHRIRLSQTAPPHHP